MPEATWDDLLAKLPSLLPCSYGTEAWEVCRQFELLSDALRAGTIQFCELERYLPVLRTAMR